ncbi:hypothetical protein HOLleu_06409 [Holothuria leucospilota]|uniref:Uncharacterized protein n=1 Tax=Holothuria leucospilota TaxID=206669 RepID=A0A9Q1CN18_HOLLE|nr:hypothetical protein HOLleu_06409 [Holothuria leucospilota]
MKYPVVVVVFFVVCNLICSLALPLQWQQENEFFQRSVVGEQVEGFQETTTGDTPSSISVTTTDQETTFGDSYSDLSYDWSSSYWSSLEYGVNST